MNEQGPPLQARVAPAAGRNLTPILAALGPLLPDRGTALEIASGTGEHALAFAKAFPSLTWRPSDLDDTALESIAAWRASQALANLDAPIRLNAASPQQWPLRLADVIICINMIHISPWSATQGLFAGGAQILPPEGILFLYGPFLEKGVDTAASNLAFDADLRARDPAWGLRRLEVVNDLALSHGFDRIARIEMPANNLSVAFRRSGSPIRASGGAKGRTDQRASPAAMPAQPTHGPRDAASASR